MCTERYGVSSFLRFNDWTFMNSLWCCCLISLFWSDIKNEKNDLFAWNIFAFARFYSSRLGEFLNAFCAVQSGVLCLDILYSTTDFCGVRWPWSVSKTHSFPLQWFTPLALLAPLGTSFHRNKNLFLMPAVYVCESSNPDIIQSVKADLQGLDRIASMYSFEMLRNKQSIIMSCQDGW